MRKDLQIFAICKHRLSQVILQLQTKLALSYLVDFRRQYIKIGLANSRRQYDLQETMTKLTGLSWLTMQCKMFRRRRSILIHWCWPYWVIVDYFKESSLFLRCKKIVPSQLDYCVIIILYQKQSKGSNKNHISSNRTVWNRLLFCYISFA